MLKAEYRFTSCPRSPPPGRPGVEELVIQHSSLKMVTEQSSKLSQENSYETGAMAGISNKHTVNIFTMDNGTFENIPCAQKLEMLKNTPEELAQYYRLYAKTYDQDFGKNVPDRPLPAYRLILNYFPKTDIRILDIGAGTGIVGEGLKALGYKNLDCLDGSQEMLDIAKEKGIYKNVICSFLGEGYRTSIPDDTYDCVVAVGCFATNCHMREDAFPEMIRVTKPGGLIIIVTSETYQTLGEYLDNLEPAMLDYSKKGIWSWVLRQQVEHYTFGKPGISYVFRKMKNVT